MSARTSPVARAMTAWSLVTAPVLVVALVRALAAGDVRASTPPSFDDVGAIAIGLALALPIVRNVAIAIDGQRTGRRLEVRLALGGATLLLLLVSAIFIS